jgi:hypothetical protein
VLEVNQCELRLRARKLADSLRYFVLSDPMFMPTTVKVRKHFLLKTARTLDQLADSLMVMEQRLEAVEEVCRDMQDSAAVQSSFCRAEIDCVETWGKLEEEGLRRWAHRLQEATARMYRNERRARGLEC